MSLGAHQKLPRPGLDQGTDEVGPASSIRLIEESEADPARAQGKQPVGGRPHP